MVAKLVCATWIPTALSTRSRRKSFRERFQKTWTKALIRVGIQKMITGTTHWKK